MCTSSSSLLLRKTYGQIVDDYMFSTKMVHERDRQLEELLDQAAFRGVCGECMIHTHGTHTLH